VHHKLCTFLEKNLNTASFSEYNLPLQRRIKILNFRKKESCRIQNVGIWRRIWSWQDCRWQNWRRRKNVSHPMERIRLVSLYSNWAVFSARRTSVLTTPGSIIILVTMTRGNLFRILNALIILKNMNVSKKKRNATKPKSKSRTNRKPKYV